MTQPPHNVGWDFGEYGFQEEPADSHVTDLDSPQENLENLENLENQRNQRNQASPVEKPEDSMDDEVEARIGKAMVYRAVIEGDLFGEEVPYRKEVEEELRQWARSRLAVLLNLSGSAPQSDIFTSEEVEVLKRLAAQVVSNKLEPGKARVQKMSVPVPRARLSLSNKTPTKQSQKPKPKTRQTSSLIKDEPTPTAMTPKGAIPTDGQVFESNGRKYKAKWVKVQKKQDIPPTMIGVKKGGNYYKVIKQDVTNQVIDSGTPRIPMPQVGEMDSITAGLAAQAANGLQAHIDNKILRS